MWFLNVACVRHIESFDRVRVHTNTVGCECSKESVIVHRYCKARCPYLTFIVHATLDAKSHVTTVNSILDLEVSIAAPSGSGDFQFRDGVYLVDTDEASGGDSEKLASAIIESEVISTLECRCTGCVVELHRRLGVRALKSCALIL